MHQGSGRGEGPTRRRRAAALVAIALLAAAGCSSGSAADGGPTTGATTPSAAAAGADATVTVTPEDSKITEQIAIEVTGLAPGTPATVRVTSTDAEGIGWVSATRYAADAHGTIHPGETPGATPGFPRDAMAPIWAMQPTDRNALAGGAVYAWGPEAQPFTVSVLLGSEEVASAEFRRGTTLGVAGPTTTVAEQGFVGTLWMPPEGVAIRVPAFVHIGANGGLLGSVKGAALAAEGYPVLDVAYMNGDEFTAPGLPDVLGHIPLEYFTGAIAWLGTQPGIDPAHIWTMGTARGGEAALLLGAGYPDLVTGAVVVEGMNISLCADLCRRAPWTRDGVPVPFTSTPNRPDSPGTPEAIIRVEQIDGPVILACGARDQLWEACDFMQAIDGRLSETGHPYPHEGRVQLRAGNRLESLVPYQPRAGRFDPISSGLSRSEDEKALGHFWRIMLAFLERTGAT